MKDVSTPSPKNSEDDAFGLYSNAVALIPVRAYVPPKVVGLKYFKIPRKRILMWLKTLQSRI